MSVKTIAFTGIHGAEYGYDDNGVWFAVGMYKDKPTTWEKVWDELKSTEAYIRDNVIEAYLADFPISVRFGAGDDMPSLYRSHRPGSCMAQSGRIHLIDFYAANPDKVGLVYWDEKSHAMLPSRGSALVWTLDDIWYVDRCYHAGLAPASRPGIVDAIKRLAASHGACLKAIHSDWSGCDLEFPKRLTVRGMRLTDDGRLPYIDTVHCYQYDSSDDTVDLSTSGFEFVANDVDGADARGENYDCRCACCGDGLRYDEAIGIDYSDDMYCEHCYSENFATCEYSDTVCHVDDMRLVDVVSADGDISELYINRDSLRNDFQEYGGNLYSISSYINENDCVEVAGGIYVAACEVADSDDSDAENDFVRVLFEYDAQPREKCTFSDIWDAWILTDDLEHYDHIGAMFDATTDGRYIRDLGPVFYLDLCLQTGNMILKHHKTRHNTQVAAYSYDQALRRAGRFISLVSAALPVLFENPDCQLRGDDMTVWFDCVKSANAVI